tara:strand:+ start:1011 stop:1829 length:819 start_codon:yes stop_codon:yes gene_type:complete
MNESEIIKSINEIGIAKVENFLDNENLNMVEKILSKQKSIKNSEDAFLYRSKGNFFLKKLLYFKFFKFIKCLKMTNLSKKLKLQELSRKINGGQTKLVSIDSYYSKKSTNKVIDWHVDQAYSGKLNPTRILDPDHTVIKFFVYLTDVGPDNGSLGYIPGSNKILYYLKLGIFNKDIKYKPYWRLEDLRNLIQENDYKNYLEAKIDKRFVSNFLEQSHFITTDFQDTKKYDYELKKGDALIFDEAGVHRGAAPEKNDRLVLRFVYKDINTPEN